MTPLERLKKVIETLKEEDSNLTNEVISEKLEYRSKNYLSDILSGAKKINGLFLTRLEDIFQISREWIMTGKGEKIVEKSNINEHFSRYGKKTNNATDAHIESLKAEINRLESHCNFVQRMYEEKLIAFESNFQKLLNHQETLLRHVAAESYLAARRYAGKDDEQFQEELKNLGILISTGR